MLPVRPVDGIASLILFGHGISTRRRCGSLHPAAAAMVSRDDRAPSATRPAAPVVHRRPRVAAPAQGAGCGALSEVDETGSGPGGFVVVDPDGNTILFDQHV
jgi:hypothetical protein